MSFTTADLADSHEDLRTCDLQFRSYGKAALANGWAGIVVHGAIRDSAAIAMLDLGMGDYLYADEDGIVVGAKVPTGPMC
jgi:Aldolase/RraA